MPPLGLDASAATITRAGPNIRMARARRPMRPLKIRSAPSMDLFRTRNTHDRSMRIQHAKGDQMDPRM